MIRRLRILVACGWLGIAGCGGGGGGDGGGNGGGEPPPPPPPPASVTFRVMLTDLELVDRITDERIDATGLPVSGAVVSLDP